MLPTPAAPCPPPPSGYTTVSRAFLQADAYEEDMKKALAMSKEEVDVDDPSLQSAIAASASDDTELQEAIRLSLNDGT